MKKNSSFKLSKQSKIHAAQYLDPHKRSMILKSFIEAEIQQHIQPRLSKSKRTQGEANDA
jgi:hypothetical protein